MHFDCLTFYLITAYSVALIPKISILHSRVCHQQTAAKKDVILNIILTKKY